MTPGVLFFLLNGAGTLLLETVWLHGQIVLFGATPETYGAVLAAYFLGLAAGSWHFRRAGAREPSSRRLLAGFGGAILLSGLVPEVMGLLPPSLSHGFGHPRAAESAGRILAFLALLPACFHLGAFFPLAARAVPRRFFTLLYGVQAGGAFLGIWLGSLHLPYVVGHRATFLAALAVNLLSLPFLLALRKRSAYAGAPARPAGDAPEAFLRAGTGSAGTPLVMAFSSGFLSLLLQVLWIRFVSLATDNSIYAFGAVSLVVLVQLLVSAAAVSRLPDGLLRGWNLTAWSAALAVPGLLLSAAVFLRLTDGLSIRIFPEATGFAGSLGLAAAFIVPGYLFPSLVFPLLLRGAGREGGRDAEVGALVAVNGLGGAIGSLGGSFLLLPGPGIWFTLLAVLAGYALLPLVLPPFRSRLPLAAGALAMAVVFSPLRHPLVTPVNPYGGPPGTVVAVEEGRHGIVSVIDYQGRMLSLWLNNNYLLEAGGGGIESTVRMGRLPVMLHPGARSLAMIGLGTGITAGGFLDSGLERITLVELIPEVTRAAAEHFAPFNRGVLDDPRVRVVTDDGRHFLRAGEERFDIICSDVFTPWNERTAYLYTTDHFRVVRERLNPGGLFCLWLPMYQFTREEFLIIARSFASVFPHATVWQLGALNSTAVVALVGTDVIRTEEVSRHAAERLAAGRVSDLVEADLSGVIVRYMGPAPGADQGRSREPLNTLDRPVIERMSARDGRVLLRGEEYLKLAEELFRQPANPGGALFSFFDEGMEEYRRTGWLLDLYEWYTERGDLGRAESLMERIAALPALWKMEAMPAH